MNQIRTPQQQKDSFDLAQVTIDDGLTRREFLGSLTLAGTILIGGISWYHQQAAPYLRQTHARDESFFSGALEMTAVYNTHYDGCGKDLSFRFNAAGQYDLAFTTFDGPHQPSSGKNFRIEVRENADDRYLLRGADGTFERSSREQFTQLLQSLRERSCASTQIKLSYRAADGTVTTDRSYF